jgi:hypothetical protein
MTTDRKDHLERDLAQTHLLITRGQLAEAKAMLPQLARDGASQQDVQPLLDAIAAREVQAEERSEGRRSIRYQLGLQSTGRRVLWFLAGIAGTVYGVWRAIEAAGEGSALGYAAIITTREHTRSGSYLWSRPVYVDLLIGCGWILAGVAAMAVVVWAARGAEQWEEMEPRNESSRWNW